MQLHNAPPLYKVYKYKNYDRDSRAVRLYADFQCRLSRIYTSFGVSTALAWYLAFRVYT